MRFHRIGFVCSLALTVFASACGSVTGGSQNDGGPACQTLDEAACRARPDCAVAVLPQCGCGNLTVCYDANKSPVCNAGICQPPPLACSLITDEASCRARTDCEVLTCPDCNGGTRFVGCGAPGSGAACPAIACPLPCGQVTTKDACEARTDCHSVFVDPHTCACTALGCCAQFSRCADGDKAMCKAPSGLACGAATPYCEGPYVVSYTAVCFEGCVQSTDCAP